MDFQVTWLGKTCNSLGSFQSVCSLTRLRDKLWFCLLLAPWGATSFQGWRPIFFNIFPICDLLISSIGIDTVEANLCLPSVSLERSGIAEGGMCELNPRFQRIIFPIGKPFFPYNFCGCCYCKLSLVLKVCLSVINQSITLEASLHTDSHTQIHTAFLNACISFSITSMFINTSESELLFISVTRFELNVYILKPNIWFFWSRVLK